MVSKENLRQGDFVWHTWKHTWAKVHKVLDTLVEIDIGGRIELTVCDRVNIIYNALEVGDCVMHNGKQYTVSKLTVPYFADWDKAVELFDQKTGVKFYTRYDAVEKVCNIRVNKALEDYCESIFADEKSQEDIVKSPNHYTAGGLEVKTVMKAKLSGEEFKGYCKGNILKYLMRAKHKGAERQDYRKAAEYMNWLTEAA